MSFGRPDGYSGSPRCRAELQLLSGVFLKKTPHCTPFKTSHELENRRRILDGAAIAAAIKQEVAEEVKCLARQG
jgi:hypothetical protein